MNTEIEYIQVSSTKMEHLIIKVCAAVLKGFTPRGEIKVELEYADNMVTMNRYSQKLRKITPLTDAGAASR